MPETDIETFYPTSQADWRKWLKKNHATQKSVWVVFHKLKTGMRCLTWSEAVDEALCFGWIDSKAKPLDDKTYMQFFSRRKSNSVWSKINKDKVLRLMDDGLMAPAGLASIEIAKQNGSWAILDEVEELKIPADLANEFKKHPGSKQYFLSHSKSVIKMMLQWLVLAKRPETRQKRIVEIAELAGKKQKPKQF